MRFCWFRQVFRGFLIAIAIYPIALVGIWALVMIGVVAADLHMPADTMPLVYGLVFAGMTVALIDLLGMASVVLALVSSANLIEYAQLVVPGRSASPVDFLAGFAGVVVGAVLVWVARTLVLRNNRQDEIIYPEASTDTGAEEPGRTACV